MLKNYLRVAFRNFKKHQVYSIINISGLAIGLTCCILIMLYVQDEFSYDRFQKNSARVYRVISDEITNGQTRHLASTSGPLAPALRTDFPEIENVVGLFPYRASVQFGVDKRFVEDRFFFADSTVFDMFPFKFKSGNPRTALRRPYSLVLTEAAAQKYFGDDSAIGQTMRVEGQFDFTVVGVLENPPHNSHFHFDFLAPMEHVPEIIGFQPHWYWPLFYTYVQLPNRAARKAIESQLAGFVSKHIRGESDANRTFRLQPLTEIHLNSDLENELEPTGSRVYIFIFSAIAFFILLVACINFMNLATARSESRAREVGFRKVVGAHRTQLVKQFLGESLFYAFLSTLVALVLVELLLPTFSQLVGRTIAVNYIENWPVTIGLVVLTLLTGILSGIYPALFLSNFRPLSALQHKTSISMSGRPVRLRAVLVVLQFAVSIVLIFVTYVVNGQLSYIQNKRLGFNKEHVVVIPIRDAEIQNDYETVKHALLTNPDITGATVLSNFPWKTGFYDFPINAEGLPDDAEINFQILLVDHDFIPTFEMKVVSGRDFSKFFRTDQVSGVILNETAVKKLGWNSAVGKTFEIKQLAAGQSVKGRVVGVVKDFHFRSLRHEVDPLVMVIAPVNYYVDNFAVRISGSHVQQTLAFLEQKWREFAPRRAFDYFFLDEDFDKLYRHDQRIGEMLGDFCLLAIFIACLGLFGLASFTAEQRRKEIGIRKVLGARLGTVVVLLTKNLVKLVLLANLLAWPVAWYAMNRWLQNFAYRIEISWWVFALAGGLALVIAMLTVGTQAIRAALANPVESLRYE